MASDPLNGRGHEGLMREDMAEDWADPNEAADEADEVRVGRIVQHLLSLAGDEEARRLLGLDGTLEDNLDMMFRRRSADLDRQRHCPGHPA